MLAVGVLAVVLQPGLLPFGEDRSDGSLRWVFYDPSGNPIDDLAFVVGGSEIGSFAIVCTLNAFSSSLADIEVTGDIRLVIYGFYYNVKYEAMVTRELETISGVLYGEDKNEPFSLVFNFPFQMSILDPYMGYKDTGWQIRAYVDASVVGTFTNGDTVPKEWSGIAAFDVAWRVDDYTLTGTIGYEYP